MSGLGATLRAVVRILYKRFGTETALPLAESASASANTCSGSSHMKSGTFECR